MAFVIAYFHEIFIKPPKGTRLLHFPVMRFPLKNRSSPLKKWHSRELTLWHTIFSITPVNVCVRFCILFFKKLEKSARSTKFVA